MHDLSKTKATPTAQKYKLLRNWPNNLYQAIQPLVLQYYDTYQIWTESQGKAAKNYCNSTCPKPLKHCDNKQWK